LNVPSASSGEKAEQERIRTEHELVTAVQARWGALRMALEPRRYPCRSPRRIESLHDRADVVLTRFESKVSEVTVAGTARSPMDAYNYFNAVSKDGPLAVYGWSMLPPSISGDGSASFEIKGKMR
jgi:hypothetical protein